jgi:tetratricopeptide (TPR) repeat protein
MTLISYHELQSTLRNILAVLGFTPERAELCARTQANHFPHEQAIQSFKAAISLDPNLGEAHHQLGRVYYHIGLFDKAEEEIKKALKR